jgi:hypothetical protein
VTNPVASETTLAVGGDRQVPVPDPAARDYLLLALRLDQHVPGLVDGYFGPADLKATVDTEQLRSPARLADDASALIERLPSEVEDDRRRAWLSAQLAALRTQALVAAGAGPAYLELLTRSFGWTPARRDEYVFAAAAAEIDRLLPGSARLADRVAAWDARFEIDVDRLPGVIEWLIERFRARAGRLFGLPDGEDLRIGLVRNQPWSGYNWYDGGRRSRVDINTDLPVRAADLVHTAAHETYPGHHLEHAWKEADLVDGRRRLEASVLLINTPECLISEGLADVGSRFAVPPEESVDLLVELFGRAGLSIASHPAEAREAAARTTELARPRRVLSAARVNAAFMRHADGASHEATRAYLEDVGHVPTPLAEKRLEFIEHPLWRTYVFVYHEGEELLERWLAGAPPGERASRFGRLLHEQLTPAAIDAEIAADASVGQPGESVRSNTTRSSPGAS